MSGWNSLSLREKAEMMRAAIRRGITNLSDIKQLYNDSLDIDDIEKVPTYEDLSYNGDLPPVDVTAQQMRNYANGGRIYSSGGTAPSWKTRARLGLWKGLSDSRNNTGGAYSTPGNINLPAGSLRGNEAAQYAMKFFMDRGMTKYAAAGLVGNLMRESGLVPNAVNKSGKNPTYAYGIAQWLGPRRDKLFARYGSNPTLEQQLDFVWDELNTTHRSGLRALQNAKNYQDAMMAALGYYEFSAGPQGALRAILKTGQNADLAIGRGMQYAAQLMGMPNISNEDIQRIKNGYINDRNFDMSSFGVATPEAMSMQVPMENPNLSMWQPTVPEAFGMSSQPNMPGYVTKSEYDSINARLDEMAKMEQERQLAIQQEQEKAQKRAEREQVRNNALFAFNLMNNSFAPQSNQNNNGFFTPIAEANPAFTPFAMVGAYGGKLGKKFAGGGSKGNYSYNRANAEEAMAYLMSEGFPRHTAAAIVGAGIRESGMNPYQHNLDGGKAYGLYQWLDQLGKGGKPVGPQRKSKLFEMYGEDAGLLPQMKYLVWEMNNVLPAWEREKILNAPDVPAAAKEFTYRFGSGQGNRSDAELRSYIASTGQDVDEAVRRAINYGNEMLDYYPDLNMWKQKWATESTSQPQDDTIIRRQTPQTDYLKPIDLNAPFQPDYNLMSTMMERPIYPYQGLYDSKAVVLPMSNTHVTDEGMLMDTRSGEQYTAAAPTLETTAPYNKEAFNVSGNVITPLIVKNNSATNNSFRRGGRLYDEGGNALMTDLALLKSSEADRANNIDELSVLPDGTLVDRYGRYGTVALPDVVVEGQTNRPQVANFEDTMALYAKDKPLERIYPEFDILAAARGLLTGGLGYTLRTLANPKTYTRTADAVVNTARAMAKPGSNFWTNPLTKAIMYGTAAGETVNAGSKALTGRTWGENVGDWTKQLTGWNPNNTFLGHMVTEGTNPGYWYSPFGRVAESTASVLGNTVERTPGVIRNLQPQNIRNHLYVAKAPAGYNGVVEATKRWGRGILSGERADIENPWWGTGKAKEDIINSLKPYAYVPGDLHGVEREAYINDWAEHAFQARTDAWRMHNRIPQKYGTFTPSEEHPGTWTDKKGIEQLKYIPIQFKGAPQIDFINSSGGNVGIPEINKLASRRILGTPNKETFGVTTISDIFDLHPFSRNGDTLIDRLQKYWGRSIGSRISKTAKKIKNTADGLRYDDKAINEYLANNNDTYSLELFDPDMFPQTGVKRYIGDKLFGLSKRVSRLSKTPSFKVLKKLNDKLAKTEVGDITGGKPFTITYDIPWTETFNITSGNEGLASGIKTIPGFHSDNILPHDVINYKFLNRLKLFNNDLYNR